MNDASEITIVRCASRERFTSISNSILQNESLSCEALAIFVHLLSRPDDWKVSIAQLAKHHRIGRDRVYRALGELRGAGFARLHTPRDPETGRVGKRHWIISEEGFADDRFPENQESGEETGKFAGFLNSSKADGSPVSWNHRKPVNSGHIQKNYLLQKNDSPLPPKGELEGEDLASDETEAAMAVDHAEAWGQFSFAWPFDAVDFRRAAARHEFEKLTAQERDDAIRCVPLFVKAWRARGRSGLPDARSWLREKGWRAFESKPSGSPSASGGRAPEASKTMAEPLPDGSWRLRPDSPQLAAWEAYERRELGRARIGLTRPSEWPPSIGARASGADQTPCAAYASSKPQIAARL